MKTLITVLAVTAILATPAAAKTARHKGGHVHHTNSLSHNAVSHNPVDHINSYCRFGRGETDPDPRIVFQLHRDCREHELEHSE